MLNSDVEGMLEEQVHDVVSLRLAGKDESETQQRGHRGECRSSALQ